ncbi:MAG: EamA family transporter [Anaerolineales bacterium]|nr:EamA family transporter [Anaerolineales bacterium]
MKLRIWAALISIYIVWGSTYLAIRFAVQSMPPFLMAATRFLVAGAILYAWRRLAGDSAPTRREWKSAAVIGLFLLLGGNGGVVWAEQRVVSGVAALLIGSVPIWLVLLDALRPGGLRPNWQTSLGILGGFVGIALLVAPSDLSGGAQQVDLLGMIALLLGALFWAVGSLYGRDAVLPSSPMLATGMEMLVGGAGLLAAGTITGEWSRLDLAAVRPESALGLAYLILFGSLVGFASYTWLLRVAPISLVATYAYVNPLVAILLGNLLAQEPLTPRVILSAVVIVGAIALINTGRAALQKRLSMGAPVSAVSMLDNK